MPGGVLMRRLTQGPHLTFILLDGQSTDRCSVLRLTLLLLTATLPPVAPPLVSSCVVITAAIAATSSVLRTLPTWSPWTRTPVSTQKVPCRAPAISAGAPTSAGRRRVEPVSARFRASWREARMPPRSTPTAQRPLLRSSRL